MTIRTVRIKINSIHTQGGNQREISSLKCLPNGLKKEETQIKGNVTYSEILEKE